MALVSLNKTYFKKWTTKIIRIDRFFKTFGILYGITYNRINTVNCLLIAKQKYKIKVKEINQRYTNIYPQRVYFEMECTE